MTAHIRRTLALAAALAATLPGLAQAQTPAPAPAPAKPGSPAILHYDLNATLPPFTGHPPAVLKISAPQGTVIDWGALTERCSLAAQSLGACSAASRIAQGAVRLRVTDPRTGSVREPTIVFNVYRDTGNGALGLMLLDDDLQTARGSVDTTNGLAITLLIQKLVDTPRSVLTVLGLTLDVGATRVQRIKRVRHRGHGRKRRTVVRYRRVRRDLVRLPYVCPAAGFYTAPVQFTYPDGSSASTASQVPCAP